MSMRTKVLLGAFLTISLLPLQARAGFCDDLWAGSYDIVVRPATDTVTLSSSGTATMNITVQNNMGFALINFVLTAKIGNTAIAATRQTGKISGTTLILARGRSTPWQSQEPRVGRSRSRTSASSSVLAILAKPPATPPRVQTR